METYSFMRELADSWVLLLMTLFFLGTIVWAFRPGSRGVHDEAGSIPFRNESIAQDSTERAETPAEANNSERVK